MSNNIPKKSLGQHWLHDQASLQAMCDIAEVAKEDTVLEIGPGLGTLTEKLLATGAHVIAIEKDEHLAAKLSNKMTDRSFYLQTGDILTYDLTQLPAGYKVVANIPYYLTSNLVRVLSESANPPQSATLLVQKEVAERLAAVPGKMSLLSVSAQIYFEPSLGPIVPPKLFTPPPKVDSQIVHLKRRKQPLYGDIDERQLFRLVKAGFSNRRKTLLNSLSAGLHVSKETATELLDRAGISPQTRPQELSLEQWFQLAKSANQSNIN